MVKRIILGDDHLGYAKKAMPELPDTDVEFVDNPFSLVERVQSRENQDYYDLIISDCDYGENAPTGIDIFMYMQEKSIAPNTRKVLWTGLADDSRVKESVKELGIELYAKSQLNAIFGMESEELETEEAKNEEGGVLVYAPSIPKPIFKSIEKVVGTIFGENVNVSSQLEAELKTGKYRLVIDTSTLGLEPGCSGIVSHDMQYFDLKKVPRVECVYKIYTVVADIAKLIAAKPNPGEE